MTPISILKSSTFWISYSQKSSAAFSDASLCGSSLLSWRRLHSENGIISCKTISQHISIFCLNYQDGTFIHTNLLVVEFHSNCYDHRPWTQLKLIPFVNQTSLTGIWLYFVIEGTGHHHNQTYTNMILTNIW